MLKAYGEIYSDVCKYSKSEKKMPDTIINIGHNVGINNILITIIS